MSKHQKTTITKIKKRKDIDEVKKEEGTKYGLSVGRRVAKGALIEVARETSSSL